MIICFGCDIQDRGNLYKTSAKIYLINESSSVVKSIDSSLGYEIQPGKTLIHTEKSEIEESKRPKRYNFIRNGSTIWKCKKIN